MNIHLTDEQKMMQTMVRDFAEQEVKNQITSMENHHFPSEVIKKWVNLV